MRQRLNQNPIVQLVFIGLLAIVVGFLLFTRVLGQGGDEAATPPAATTADPATAGTAATPTADPAAGVAPTAAAGAAAIAGALATGTPTSEFEAGTGLPKDVVKAYEANKVVVVLIVRGPGIDDQLVRRSAASLRGRDDTELFVVHAAGIARYSRITQGVDVERTPALVVLSPKRLTEGPLPEATVDYGARGVESLDQAVRDALYKGRDDLPYYPE